MTLRKQLVWARFSSGWGVRERRGEGRRVYYTYEVLLQTQVYILSHFSGSAISFILPPLLYLPPSSPLFSSLSSFLPSFLPPSFPPPLSFSPSLSLSPFFPLPLSFPPRCGWHEERENKHCSLGTVNIYSFVLSESLCPKYGISQRLPQTHRVMLSTPGQPPPPSLHPPTPSPPHQLSPQVRQQQYSSFANNACTSESCPLYQVVGCPLFRY